ncbi:hypothetical protein GWE_02650 [Chlamydia psittaci NJ1]|nr:hypothetical protein [Chlamydia psittaci]AFS28365.1 putative membrane domain protein [Chlamydia psittaci NJ1]KPZ36689.1 hypothetical protein GWE_02650 [Chlamydia psittaci NJ1]
MSLENNNFRAAFAHPQPAPALYGTSLIKTANQKISFLSIFHALGNKIGACLCLNPESDSKAGWVFAFVLSAYYYGSPLYYPSPCEVNPSRIKLLPLLI